MTSLDNFVIRTPFWWTPPGCADGGTEAAMLPKGFAFEIKIAKRLITFKLGALPPIPRRGILISSTCHLASI